jgi:hypothetical protein
MADIIAPVAPELLEAELTPDKLLKKTNFGGNEIYTFKAADCPNLMLEVGRLREIAFRDAGGGTGKETDIDEFDISEKPYTQLIVWDTKFKEILGGYRYIHCADLKGDSAKIKNSLATGEMFSFSNQFIEKYLPHTIELGRSFVQPAYQAAQTRRKTLFALDNLWDGLGGLIVKYPEVKYFFGKVTMYTHFDIFSRDLILYFLNTYFPDKDKLVFPDEILPNQTDVKILSNLLAGQNYTENYKILTAEVRKHGEVFPPLINSYMNLSPTMKCFGTGINHHFGDVEETGILITINDIYDSKKRRHVFGKHSRKEYKTELNSLFYRVVVLVRRGISRLRSKSNQ